MVISSADDVNAVREAAQAADALLESRRCCPPAIHLQRTAGVSAVHLDRPHHYCHPPQSLMANMQWPPWHHDNPACHKEHEILRQGGNARVTDAEQSAVQWV